MARRKHEEESSGGAPAWMATYGDLVTLLLCFFVLLFAMSSVDVSKFKAAMSSFANQIDVLPGGEALTGEELITNGISQLSEIAIILEQMNMPIDRDEDTDSETEPPEDSMTDPERADALAALIEAQAFADQVAEQFYERLQIEGLAADVSINATPNYVILTLKGEALFDPGQAVIRSEAERIVSVIASTYQDEFNDYSLIIEGHTDDIPMNTFQFPSNWYLSAARAIAVGEYLIENIGIPDEKIACTGYGEFQPIRSNDTPEGRAANRRVEIKVNLGGLDQFVGKDILFNENDNTPGEE